MNFTSQTVILVPEHDNYVEIARIPGVLIPLEPGVSVSLVNGEDVQRYWPVRAETAIDFQLKDVTRMLYGIVD